MLPEKHLHTVNELRVMVDALLCAYRDDASFNVYGFEARYGHPVNRHTRDVLNQMVIDGVLGKTKRLYPDGHYRMVYYAANKQPKLVEP